MSCLKARLSVRWPSIREHRLAKGGWVDENAEALICETFRRIGHLRCIPSLTCPNCALCTGRTSKIQAIFMAAILVLSQPGCDYCLYWTPLLFRLLAGQRGSASRPGVAVQASGRIKGASGSQDPRSPRAINLAVEYVGNPRTRFLSFCL